MNFWNSINSGEKVRIYPVAERDLDELASEGSFGVVYFGVFVRFFPEVGAVLPVPGFKPGHEKDFECMGVARTADGLIIAVREVRKFKCPLFPARVDPDFYSRRRK